MLYFSIDLLVSLKQKLIIYLLCFSGGIEKMAWDSTGERLALSYKNGDEKYAGLIAVYDVRRAPLVSVSLM